MTDSSTGDILGWPVTLLDALRQVATDARNGVITIAQWRAALRRSAPPRVTRT